MLLLFYLLLCETEELSIVASKRRVGKFLLSQKEGSSFLSNIKLSK